MNISSNNYEKSKYINNDLVNIPFTRRMIIHFHIIIAISNQQVVPSIKNLTPKMKLFKYLKLKIRECLISQTNLKKRNNF